MFIDRDSFGSLNRSPAFTIEDVQDAASWGFNCGPGSLCGLLRVTPIEIRSSLGDFESKGYTNPTLMASILRRLNVPFRRVFESAVEPFKPIVWPEYGLVRVQWAGPWTKEGVPMAARYRRTHWIGFRKEPHEVFDINAMCVDGWLPFNEWSDQLVPWLLKQVLPAANGEWWPTHCWDLL